MTNLNLIPFNYTTLGGPRVTGNNPNTQNWASEAMSPLERLGFLIFRFGPMMSNQAFRLYVEESFGLNSVREGVVNFCFWLLNFKTNNPSYFGSFFHFLLIYKIREFFLSLQLSSDHSSPSTAHVDIGIHRSLWMEALKRQASWLKEQVTRQQHVRSPSLLALSFIIMNLYAYTFKRMQCDSCIFVRVLMSEFWFDFPYSMIWWSVQITY